MPDLRADVPLISVVIPTAGRPATLQRAIKSVLNQTFTQYEILVVRDGVDPTTDQVVAAFDDSRIRLIGLQEKVGGAEARNVGARAAQGRWVALLDDDDEWLPEKLERQYALALAQPDGNYAITTRYLYTHGEHAPQVWPGHVPQLGESLSEFLFAPRGGFQTSVYLVPRQLFLEKPFKPGLKKHQDWDWFLRLAAGPGFRLVWDISPLSIYYAPNEANTSVSTVIDWRFSAQWARDNLALMTRRAYAMFLVRICLRGAVESNAPWSARFALLSEIFGAGKISPRLAVEIVAAFVLPSEFRKKLSAWVAPLRAARA